MAIEKTVSEIAEILGVSRQAVNNRVKALAPEDTQKNEKGVTVVTRSGLIKLEEIYKKTRGEGFGAEVKRRIMLGTYVLSSGYYDAYYKKAQQVRTLIKQDFDKVFEEYDVIIGPTAPTVAFNIGEEIDDPVTMYANDILTIPVNMGWFTWY